MIRNCSLDEISDGKLYGINDLVKADCNDCKDCSACCKGMGKSIILDPYDINRLCTNLNTNFENMIGNYIELNVVDGIILPNMKMNHTFLGEEKCSFLNEKGRCEIHAFRPGICRLFPLGRYYEKDSFSYFLQVHECKNENKTKVKVKKWIDTPDVKRYEEYICAWHYFLKDAEEVIRDKKNNEETKKINLMILNLFFIKPYEKTLDFYEQFEERLKNAKSIIK